MVNFKTGIPLGGKSLPIGNIAERDMMSADAKQGKRAGSGGLWRKVKRKQRRTNKHDGMEMTDHQDYMNDDAFFYMQAPESATSLQEELGETGSNDSFLREVTKKTNAMMMGRLEADTEVFIDRLIKKEGDSDKALLFAVSKMRLESRIQMVVNNLISRGADTSTSDESLKTPLHYAVQRNLKGVAAKLLENDALPHARDKDGVLPLKIAMDNGNDAMCSLLLAYMPNYFVRGLFLSDGAKKCEFSFHTLLKSPKPLKQTILNVLDSMIEPHSAIQEGVIVYYNVLESDEEGRQPTDPLFEASNKSPLQVIAKQGDKTIIHHDTVRLLVRKKWKKYARGRFQFNSFMYILALFALTYSLILAVVAPDPTKYDTSLQNSRALMEVGSTLMVFFTLLTEVNQLRRHKLEYFQDIFDWLDFSSSVLLLAVIPLRFTHNNAQWHVFAFGYLIWTIRVFKYAAVFRQTGAYSQILYRVMAHDFPQFTLVFLVILLAFSGSLFLSLRGENGLSIHNETRVISTIVTVCFMLTSCVILLNLLIAQLTDTYQKVQQDAQRGLEVNRAWIVTRVELNSLFFKRDYRKTHYVECEVIKNLKKVLAKWESPPINEMNKYIHDIWDSLENHKMNLLTIQHRMARQEHALMKIQDQLNYLITFATGYQEDAGNFRTSWRPSEPRKPKFYRSDSETPKDIDDGHRDTSTMHDENTAFTNSAFRKED